MIGRRTFRKLKIVNQHSTPSMKFLDEPSPLLVRAALMVNLHLKHSLNSNAWSQSANKRPELRATMGLPNTRVKPPAAGRCGIIRASGRRGLRAGR